MKLSKRDVAAIRPFNTWWRNLSIMEENRFLVSYQRPCGIFGSITAEGRFPSQTRFPPGTYQMTEAMFGQLKLDGEQVGPVIEKHITKGLSSDVFARFELSWRDVKMCKMMASNKGVMFILFANSIDADSEIDGMGCELLIHKEVQGLNDVVEVPIALGLARKLPAIDYWCTILQNGFAILESQNGPFILYAELALGKSGEFTGMPRWPHPFR